MTKVNAANPAAPDDLVTCLAKAAGAYDKPPRIVTISGAPVKHLMSEVFGPTATVNLIRRKGSDAGGPAGFTGPHGRAASPLDFDPARYAVLPRFVDLAEFELVGEDFGEWLARSAVVIVHFPLARMLRENLSQAGFRQTRNFTYYGRPTMVLLRAPEKLPSGRGGSKAPNRPPLARLVIVDPCLGAAAGHYLRYAHRLTRGAQSLGAEVVWAANARLNDRVAPAGVKVRHSFPRSFFDLGAEDAGTVDLSPGLAKGWVNLLAEFDGEGTHFLMHSADAHQLRGAAKLLERRPQLRSAIHINLHTDPLGMPGRTAGEEAHGAVLRLRKAPEWERSLFFWAENRRLGRWMSEWLQDTVPALPFLAPSGPSAAVGERKSAGRLTLSVLGESRATKGFLDLPELADRIAAAPALAQGVKMVIQNWPPFRGDAKAHEEAVARLRRHRFVEIIEGVLKGEDYSRRLAEADALLLPYHPGSYNLQGSGILVEGFSYGAVIVARAGATIEDEADKGVVVTYRTPQELVEQLTRLARDIETVSGRARQMAVGFRQENSPRGYVAALDARARGGA